MRFSPRALIVVVAVVLAFLGVSAQAEVITHTVSVTSTSKTVSPTGDVVGFASARPSVTIINDTSSSNELYARVFACGETAAAATTSAIRIEKGEARSFKYTGPGLGWCAVSLVTASAETATARVSESDDTATVVGVSIGDVTVNALTDTELRATPVPVTGGGGGVEYTEGATDSTITGGAIVWEDAANTLVSLSAAKPLPTTPRSAAGVEHVQGLTDTQLRATAVPVSGTVTATGPLTDTQLRATAVPVSGTVTASGPVTDTQLRATAVPVSGPVTDAQLRATAVPVSGPLTDTQLRATAVPISVATIPSHAVTNAGTFPVQAAQSGTWTQQPGNTPNTVPWLFSIHDGTTKASVFDLTSSNPSAVAIVDATGAQIGSFGGGVQYTEGDTDATITGTALMWEDASSTLVAASATKPVPVNIISGAGSGGTAAVDGSAFTLDTTNVTVAGCVEATDSMAAGALGGMKCGADRELDIDVVSSALPTGASTLAEQQTQTTSLAAHTTALQLLDNVPVAQGSTTTGQWGQLMFGTVTTAAPSYTTGQVMPLSIDLAGNLRVNVMAVTAPDTVIDGGVFAPDTDGVTIMAGCVTGTSVGAADKGCIKILTDRRTVIVGGDAAGSPTAGGVVAVQGISGGTAVPMSLATLPALVAGTANIGDVDILTLPALVAGTANIGDVDVVTLPALVAGNANIGDVDIVTLPALPAGTNNIGDVDIVTLPALAAGSALIGQTATAGTATTTNSNLECYITSAASTNATNCKASAGNIYGYDLVNTTSTVYYLRMYNLASAPTCSSATGFTRSIPIPHGTATGAGFVADYSAPVGYATGIGFCLTAGGDSVNNTNAATGVYVTIRYK